MLSIAFSATSRRILIFLKTRTFYTNRLPFLTKPVNPHTKTTLFWNRSPELFKAVPTRMRTKNMRFQKCLESWGHGLNLFSSLRVLTKYNEENSKERKRLDFFHISKGQAVDRRSCSMNFQLILSSLLLFFFFSVKHMKIIVKILKYSNNYRRW